MHYIYVSKDRQKRLPKGQNYATDLDIEQPKIPLAISCQLASLTNELVENPFLSQGHAESLWRRIHDLLGRNVRVLMSDLSGQTSQQYRLT